MARNRTNRTPRRRLLELAAAQHGAFTADQALGLGVTYDQLTAMVRSGTIRRRRRGLYVVAGSPADHHQATMLAVLAGPPGCVASHESAAFLHGLLPAPSQVHVTVRRDERVRLDNVVAHRSVLVPAHRAAIGSIPVTSLHRTLVDLASVSDLDSFAAVLDPVITTGRVRPERLLRTIDEIVIAPGRHGTTLLRVALDVWLAPIAPGSPAEARLLRRLHERGYDGFEPQHEVVVDGRTYYLDVAWPERRCALEYAGAEFHGPRRWPRDERRSAAIAAAGWDVYEVDAIDVVPSGRRLWDWLETRFRHAA